MIIANTSAAIGAEKSTIRIKIAGHEWLKLSNANKAIIAKNLFFSSKVFKSPIFQFGFAQQNSNVII